MARLAFSRRLGASPSAAPMMNTTAGLSCARQPCSRPAKAPLLRLSPRSSIMTLTARSGMTLAMAIDSSSMRRAVSPARLSLISTMSKEFRPTLRPASAARLRKRSASSRSGPCFSRPTATTMIRMRNDTRGSCVGSSRWRPYAPLTRPPPLRPRRRPHLLQIVEGADFRPKDMNDDVAGVDQHPVAMRHAFDPRVRHAGLGEVFQHAIGDRANMAVRPARGHNHAVGDRRFAGEIDGDGVLGLHVTEAGEDQAENLLGVRTHLGDRFGGAACAGTRDCRCWQGSFPFAASPPREAGLP